MKLFQKTFCSLLLFMSLSFLYINFCGALKAASKPASDLKANIRGLQQDISDLELSVSSLDDLSDKLSKELLSYEDSLRSRLTEVIVPLLGWPETRFSLNANSWVELQRTNAVLREVQERLIHEPLRLMANRELRISEAQELRHELSEQLESLGSKKELLELRLSELGSSDQSGVRRKISHARAAKKKKIGDIEENAGQP